MLSKAKKPLISVLFLLTLVTAIAFGFGGCAPVERQEDTEVDIHDPVLEEEQKEPEQEVVLVELKSPVIDGNNIKFVYRNDEIPADTDIFLRGNMPDVGWDAGVVMIRDEDRMLWHVTLQNLPEGIYEYKFYSDATGWTHDPLNPLIVGVFGNSAFSIGAKADIKIVSVAGSFQQTYAQASGINMGNWVAGDKLTKLNEIEPGSGIYEGTFKLPAGRWGYKITIREIKDGIASVAWIPEGLGNERFVELDKDTEVTFRFNYGHFRDNPDTQPYVDSINYTPLHIEVFDAYGKSLGFMQDDDFDSIYRFDTGFLAAGTSKFSIDVNDGAHKEYTEIELKSDNSLELVYYAEHKILTTDYAPAIDNEIYVDKIYHNSHDIKKRNPFGAVEQGTEVNISIRTAKNDVSLINLVVAGKPLPMARIGGTDYDKWSVEVPIREIGIHGYHFIVQDGTRVVYYTNEPGFGGKGRVVDDIAKVGNGYPLVVYRTGFRTPDWMKNSITYQIFPERFRDGNPLNNRAKTLGRGDIPLVFPQWSDFRGFENTRAQFVYPREIRRILKDGLFHEININQWGLAEYKGDWHWHNDFYGGDLQGIIDSLDYLQSLGVRTLYLNPIFEATSVHKYDASDKRMIDRMFGDNELFKRLTSEARNRGMHVIMDGIFNHVGDDSKYFDRYGKFPETIGAYEAWVYRQMKENNQIALDWYNRWYREKVEANAMAWGPESDFDRWFVIRDDGTYQGWWGFDSLPEFGEGGHRETSISSFMDYMIRDENSIAAKWIKKYGSSGWRLDVSPQVETSFWKEFRNRILNIEHPSGRPIMIAENWGDATADFLGDTFDSTMNYLFRGAVISFVTDERLESKFANDGLTPEEIWNPIDARKLDRRLMTMYEKYPREAFYALMNLLGSHDSPRILRVLGNIETDRLLYPGQRNAIARGLGLDPAALGTVYTIPDIWRQGLATRRNVMEFVSERNELAKRRLTTAFILQMGYPGSPTVYYGDELGMTGYHDPDNRRQMRWDKVNENNSKLNIVRRIAQIRAQHQVLKTGGLATLMAEHGGSVYAFGRYIAGERDALGNKVYTVNYLTGERLIIAEHNGKAVIAVNKAREAKDIIVDVSEFAADGTVFYDNLNGNAKHLVENGKLELTIDGLHGVMLVDKPFKEK